MEDLTQSLTDNTNGYFQQRKIPATPFFPSSCRTWSCLPLVSPFCLSLGMMRAFYMRSSHMMPVIGPFLMIIPVGPGKRPPVGEDMLVTHGPPVIRAAVPCLYLLIWTNKDRGKASLYQFYFIYSTSPRDYGAVTLVYNNITRKIHFCLIKIIWERRNGTKKCAFICIVKIKFF